MLHWRFQILPSTFAEATIGMLRALMRLQLKTTLVLYWALQKDARIAWPRSRHRQTPFLPSCLTICKCHRDGVPSLKLQQLCCVQFKVSTSFFFSDITITTYDIILLVSFLSHLREYIGFFCFENCSWTTSGQPRGWRGRR